MFRYGDLKIGTKLILAFSIIILVTIAISIISVVQLRNLDTRYSISIKNSNENINFANSALSEFNDTKIQAEALFVHFNDIDRTEFKTYINSIRQSEEDFKTFVNELRKKIGIGNGFYNSSNADNLEKCGGDYYGQLNVMINLLESGNLTEAQKMHDDSVKNAAGLLQNEYSMFISSTMKEAEFESSQDTAAAYSTRMILMILTGVAAVICALLAFFSARSITKPLIYIGEAAKKMASGDLSVKIQSNYRDEIGVLANDIAKVIDSVNALQSEVVVLDERLNSGDVEASIDTSKFQNDYKKMAESINGAIQCFVQDTLAAIDVINSYADGDFSKQCVRFVGKKAILHECLDRIQLNLNDINNDIEYLIDAGEKGNLSARIEDSKYRGDWNKMAVGLNNVFNSMAQPISESIEVLKQLSGGSLSTRVLGEYSGEFSELKNAINFTITTLQNYISEISRVLNEMSGGNYDISVEADFSGDFVPIKNSLNDIIESLNTTLTEIARSTEQLALSVNQISESSMYVAHGASEQSHSVEQLTNAIRDISIQTKSNSENANNANVLAAQTKENSEMGNNEMKNMVLAMDDINQSSRSISKVIKVIDEIAFQTNLLALNAAVEAARAGQHGKGFGIVAEQVRALAARCSEAVNETTALIENSFDKVQHGISIAGNTAKILEKSVSQIVEISALVEDVANSSAAQLTAISQIDENVMRISNVTQTNSSTSEEQASAAEELASQADVFKNMVSKYRLKKQVSKFQQPPNLQVQKTPMQKPVQNTVINRPTDQPKAQKSSPLPKILPPSDPIQKIKDTPILADNKTPEPVTKTKESPKVSSLIKAKESPRVPTLIKNNDNPMIPQKAVKKEIAPQGPQKPAKPADSYDGISVYSDFDSKDFGKY